MAIRSGITRSSVRRSGSALGSGGVDKIIAGAGISVTPPAGTGNVTVANDGVISVNGENDAVNITTSTTVTPGLHVDVTTGLGIITLSQTIGADWDVALMRVYAIDGSRPDDSGVGFADPATNSLASYQAAIAAAGAVAKKTFAGLAAILPRNGDGRMVCIIIASGTYAGGLNTFVGGVSGYADGSFIRGTSTNTTAASVAFSGSDGDRTFVGAVTATGMNAAGYNPTGAATPNSLPCTKVGGAAPGFTANGLAIPVGWRIRFDANTTTVALRNQCCAVAEIPNTTTLIPQFPFNDVPVASDVFYLEMAGVVCGGFGIDGLNVGNPAVAPGVPTGLQVTGVRSTGQIVINGGFETFSFCGCATLVAGAIIAPTSPIAMQVTPYYADPFATFFVGGGLRSEGFGILGNGNFKNILGLVVATSTLQVDAATALQWEDGCAAQRLIVEDCYLGQALAVVTGGPLANVGTNISAVQGPIIRANGGTAGLVIAGSQLALQGMTIAGTGAQPAISVRGVCTLAISGVIAGSTGNTNVGMDLVNARGSLIILAATPTVTGTAGDVRLAGGQIITWAQAILGITDSAGNRIISSNLNVPLATLKFTGALFGAGGAAASVCADTSPGLLLVNEGNLIRYPTSQKVITRLRVTVIALSTNTIGNTVTLFKNGVATTMVVTIPAAQAAGTKFVDSAHPILFADGDDFMVAMANAGADVAAVTKIAATIEYAV